MLSGSSFAKLLACATLASNLVAPQVWAQSAQYQRAGAKKATVLPPAGPSAHVDAKAAPAPSAAPEAASDKLDISDIEKKYWAPKDTDFSVVQNRLYTKAHRFALTAGYGMTVNDSYNEGDNVELIGNYYWSERYGVQLTYINTSSVDNKLTRAFREENGVLPDYNKITGFYGASFNWVPFYAKMSFLSSKILYFDMSVSPGIGMTQYNQMRVDGNKSESALTYTLDLTQQLFFSKNFAFRFDFQNHWFNESRVKYQTRSGIATGSEVSSDFNHTIILLFGMTVFF